MQTMGESQSQRRRSLSRKQSGGLTSSTHRTGTKITKPGIRGGLTRTSSRRGSDLTGSSSSSRPRNSWNEMPTSKSRAAPATRAAIGRSSSERYDAMKAMYREAPKDNNGQSRLGRSHSLDLDDFDKRQRERKPRQSNVGDGALESSLWHGKKTKLLKAVSKDVTEHKMKRDGWMDCRLRRQDEIVNLTTESKGHFESKRLAKEEEDFLSSSFRSSSWSNESSISKKAIQHSTEGTLKPSPSIALKSATRLRKRVSKNNEHGTEVYDSLKLVDRERGSLVDRVSSYITDAASETSDDSAKPSSDRKLVGNLSSFNLLGMPSDSAPLWDL